MADQKPSIGRIVHYQSFGTPGHEYTSLARAAVITEVIDDDLSPPNVGLCILNPTGLFFTRGVYFSEIPLPGHWSWPPRVP